MYDFTDLNKFSKFLVILTCFGVFIVAFPISSAIYTWTTGYMYSPILIITAFIYWTSPGKALLAATIGVMLIPAAFIMMVKILSPKAELYGSARFAFLSEMAKAKFFRVKKDSILVGFFKGKKIAFNGDFHCFLSALTGSGKTVSFVIPNMLNWFGSAIVLDIKQECFDITSGYRKEKLGSKILLFNPLSNNTDQFNPFDFIPEGEESISQIQNLAASLVQQNDPYWDTKARQLFTGLALMLHERGDFLGLQKTIGQIFRLIGVPGGLKESLLEYMDVCAEENQPLSVGCCVMLNAFCNEEDRPRESIVSSLFGHLELWLDPRIDRATSKSTFDPRTFRTEKQTLYLVSSPSDLERLNSVFRLILEIFIITNTQPKELFKKRDREGRKLKYPVLLMLDEFVQLGRMDKLVNSLAYIRSFGIKMASIIQSTNQLNALYGPDLSNFYEENHRCSVLFRPNRMSNKRVTEMAEALGKITARTKSHTRPWLGGTGHRSVTNSSVEGYLVTPDQIRDMPDSRQFVLVDGVRPVYAHKLIYFEDSTFKKKASFPAADLPSTVELTQPQGQKVTRVESLATKIKKIFIPEKEEPFTENELEEITRQFCDVVQNI